VTADCCSFGLSAPWWLYSNTNRGTPSPCPCVLLIPGAHTLSPPRHSLETVWQRIVVSFASRHSGGCIPTPTEVHPPPARAYYSYPVHTHFPPHDAVLRLCGSGLLFLLPLGTLAVVVQRQLRYTLPPPARAYYSYPARAIRTHTSPPHRSLETVWQRIVFFFFASRQPGGCSPTPVES